MVNKTKTVIKYISYFAGELAYSMFVRRNLAVKRQCHIVRLFSSVIICLHVDVSVSISKLLQYNFEHSSYIQKPLSKTQTPFREKTCFSGFFTSFRHKPGCIVREDGLRLEA